MRRFLPTNRPSLVWTAGQCSSQTQEFPFEGKSATPGFKSTLGQSKGRTLVWNISGVWSDACPRFNLCWAQMFSCHRARNKYVTDDLGMWLADSQADFRHSQGPIDPVLKRVPTALLQDKLQLQKLSSKVPPGLGSSEGDVEESNQSKCTPLFNLFSGPFKVPFYSKFGCGELRG